jgi:hypothetical protein
VLVATAGDAHQPLAVDHGRVDAQAGVSVEQPAVRVQAAEDTQGVEKLVAGPWLHDLL